MDFSQIDMKALAPQLRNPHGELGREVGRVMEQRTKPINMFALDCLHIQSTDHVLEIGFGPGLAMAEVAKRTPLGHVSGIDQSEVMLKMATEKNGQAIEEGHI